MKRQSKIKRKSKETEITAKLNIEGTGQSKISTQIGFLDHMLELFSFHGFFDLSLQVTKADKEIDIHHTNEDVGIVMGKLFNKTLKDKKGIKRFGAGFAPMENTLGQVIVDISGRGHLALQIGLPGVVHPAIKDQEGYAVSYLEHFFESFAKNLGANLYVCINNPSDDLHTNVETVFKALGLALDEATMIDNRRKDEVPSTKGIID